MSLIAKLISLLSPRERFQGLILLGMIFVMALLDAIGVASIMPFMAILANPSVIQSNQLLVLLYNFFGIKDQESFILLAGITVFFLLLISMAFRAVTTYMQLRFTLMREYSIGKKLVEGYLYQKYSWFLSKHSANLGRTVLSEVQQVIYQAMLPMMTVIAQGVASFALLVLLCIIDPALALTVGAVLGISYALIFQVMKKFLSRIGTERVEANEQRYVILSDAFGAIKEVKIAGLEDVYVRRFSKPAEVYAKNQASAQAVAQLPRFALEAIAFGGMLLVILYLMSTRGEIAAALPTITLYALAGYKLMPALQQIYYNLAQLKYSKSALDQLHSEFEQINLDANPNVLTRSLNLKKFICLENINFRYPDVQDYVIKGLNLTIKAKTTVGFVGSTGSGKTTAVDIILGLLQPETGSIRIDGVELTESNCRGWQKQIGYVPQQIYLSDDTIASNIAFGVLPDQIDKDALRRASTAANLDSFIRNDLPNGYDTKVGERGVRLSGGQRQRIGIARALYFNPNVLILDEATSALDVITEEAVMDAVNTLNHNITIILIAHRISTVRQCDQIFVFEKGEIRSMGTYAELENMCTTFQAFLNI